MDMGCVVKKLTPHLPAWFGGLGGKNNNSNYSAKSPPNL